MYVKRARVATSSAGFSLWVFGCSRYEGDTTNPHRLKPALQSAGALTAPSANDILHSGLVGFRFFDHLEGST